VVQQWTNQPCRQLCPRRRCARAKGLKAVRQPLLPLSRPVIRLACALVAPPACCLRCVAGTRSHGRRWREVLIRLLDSKQLLPKLPLGPCRFWSSRPAGGPLEAAPSCRRANLSGRPPGWRPLSGADLSFTSLPGALPCVAPICAAPAPCFFLEQRPARRRTSAVALLRF